MMKKKATPAAYKKGGEVYKPCSGCPNPAKCKAMGSCMAKSKKGK